MAARRAIHIRDRKGRSIGVVRAGSGNEKRQIIANLEESAMFNPQETGASLKEIEVIEISEPINQPPSLATKDSSMSAIMTIRIISSLEDSSRSNQSAPSQKSL